MHSECSLKMTQANDKHTLWWPAPPRAIVDYLCVIGHLSQAALGLRSSFSIFGRKTAGMRKVFSWEVSFVFFRSCGCHYVCYIFYYFMSRIMGIIGLRFLWNSTSSWGLFYVLFEKILYYTLHIIIFRLCFYLVTSFPFKLLIF